MTQVIDTKANILSRPNKTIKKLSGDARYQKYVAKNGNPNPLFQKYENELPDFYLS